jgi:D-hydroxyproline dehydrogenase subunit gamma
MRITDQVQRGIPLMLFIDGEPLAGFVGETVATAMMAAGQRRFRFDANGKPRGLYCNMGTCCECMVRLDDGRGIAMRACLLPAEDGMRIATGLPSL